MRFFGRKKAVKEPELTDSGSDTGRDETPVDLEASAAAHNQPSAEARVGGAPGGVESEASAATRGGETADQEAAADGAGVRDDRAAEASANASDGGARNDTAGDGSASGGDELEEGIVEALKTVFDPEIPVNIYELGLIYDIFVDEASKAWIKMTLTSPNCPVAGTLPGDVQNEAASVKGVSSAEVELVWDPAWNPEMMSEAAKLELGFF